MMSTAGRGSTSFRCTLLSDVAGTGRIVTDQGGETGMEIRRAHGGAWRDVFSLLCQDDDEGKLGEGGGITGC